MEVDSEMTESPSYTILRIKRKRNEEPLDALVVEAKSRRKKSKAAVDLFQFAETVEGDAWADARRQKELQDRISALAQLPVDERPAPAALATAPGQLSRQSSANPRYTIVQKDVPKEEPHTQHPTSPPRVIPHKELRNATPSFMLLDAVPSEPNLANITADSEMENFLPMLKDYLKVNDISLADPPSAPAPSVPTSASTVSMTSLTDTSLSSDLQEDGDYVWDVFYRRAITQNEWNKIANFGTLIGLPPSLNDPNESDSEPEPEDEDDEDSNAEDYYKNDYPDEEDSESDASGKLEALVRPDEFMESDRQADMFHEAASDVTSDYDDADEGDHDWR
ncbi:hypothetical protein NEOLEDRAFT_1239333 [Neolentinus lepideus HHB14362 ss-1]|uniref:Probable RNA polymerase II nuclear localization protein SLC7A6OS n=1 Tax=Neolentinus lepideus HHB14362 ss-1 TaxID=1314782 RepID=A0A165UX35_9AGAM|nr:hypothetical protein NEOLEDRAFT_1239333 [Neolentinus lepideus HHB14362 ss-1]